MQSFIKKIFENKADEQVHGQFVRFGKGSYEKRAVISLHKTSKVKLKGSFEYANDFVLLVAELVDANFSGIILSKEHLDLGGEKKKAGSYSYDVENIDSSKVKEIADKVYCMLLNVETPEIKLKIKKKLPKPGKSGEKVDNKFCVLEAPIKFYPQIKEAFFWDADGKKLKAEHVYQISELIMPEGEKDFTVIREKTKRKGKIIRKLEIDKREQVKEKEFAA